MDIQNVKTERQKLAANISELVNSFQKLTDCTVKSVHLHHLFSDTEDAPITTRVEVEIKID